MSEQRCPCGKCYFIKRQDLGNPAFDYRQDIAPEQLYEWQGSTVTAEPGVPRPDKKKRCTRCFSLLEPNGTHGLSHQQLEARVAELEEEREAAHAALLSAVSNAKAYGVRYSLQSTIQLAYRLTEPEANDDD